MAMTLKMMPKNASLKTMGQLLPHHALMSVSVISVIRNREHRVTIANQVLEDQQRHMYGQTLKM